MLQQLFTLFSRINYYFLPALFKLIFFLSLLFCPISFSLFHFFPSLLCALPLFSIALITFSILHSSPLSSVDFVVAWWLTLLVWKWVCSAISAWVDLGLPAWVCSDLGVGLLADLDVVLAQAWWWSRGCDLGRDEEREKTRCYEEREKKVKII